ncbi:hypothetical protein EV648_11198 [Kribbella sp. VKM Ac-2568]|nr:hypothetical protein EV648_11198 [Kribbella sp. VKM Ac-2568]
MNGRRRTVRRSTGVVSAAAFVTAGLMPGAADAVPTVNTTAEAACKVSPGAVTAGGDHRGFTITATKPIAATEHQRHPDIYPDGLARLSGYMVVDPTVQQGYGERVYGWVVLGSSMYGSSYFTDGNGKLAPDTVERWLVGGGWGNFVAFETSTWIRPDHTVRTNQYGLRSDGVLFRWSDIDLRGWTAKASYPGFSAVKAMALISQTATYDTFLATTKGGALYTVRIPISSPMKPVVKVVRRSTWQALDSLVIERCGPTGTLLLGIDKDTKAGYLYAVGHAKGTATVIQSLGKVPTTLDDPIYFRRGGEPDDGPVYLFGE